MLVYLSYKMGVIYASSFNNSLVLKKNSKNNLHFFSNLNIKVMQAVIYSLLCS